MGRYQVVAVWQTDQPKVPRGADLFSGLWPSGLQVSLYDGRTLTVVAEVVADDAESARALVTGRAVLVWHALCRSALGAPASCAAMPLGPHPGEQVKAGLPGTAAPTGPLGRLRRWRNHPTSPLWPAAEDLGPAAGPDDDLGDDGPDDGGLAGVREPRRPKPGPGHLRAEAPLPSADVA